MHFQTQFHLAFGQTIQRIRRLTPGGKQLSEAENPKPCMRIPRPQRIFGGTSEKKRNPDKISLPA